MPKTCEQNFGSPKTAQSNVECLDLSRGRLALYCKLPARSNISMIDCAVFSLAGRDSSQKNSVQVLAKSSSLLEAPVWLAF
jgi:hypothetical protein